MNGDQTTGKTIETQRTSDARSDEKTISSCNLRINYKKDGMELFV